MAGDGGQAGGDCASKVSKATATRDLADLAAIGAIIPVGAGPVARYALNGAFSSEPIEPLISASRATVKRMIAELIAEGKIEHRGSKKTGGYFPA